jgi:hypothetical protein
MRGVVNETIRQNLVVMKKHFGEHYIARLFSGMNANRKGIKIYPEFSTNAKTDAFITDF